jgi:hypothetical protein
MPPIIIIKPYQIGLSRIEVDTTYLLAWPVYMISVKIKRYSKKEIFLVAGEIPSRL